MHLLDYYIQQIKMHGETVKFNVQVCLHSLHTEFPHFLLQKCASYCHPTGAN
jgi:hypothetical protein